EPRQLSGVLVPSLLQRSAWPTRHGRVTLKDRWQDASAAPFLPLCVVQEDAALLERLLAAIGAQPLALWKQVVPWYVTHARPHVHQCEIGAGMPSALYGSAAVE